MNEIKKKSTCASTTARMAGLSSTKGSEPLTMAELATSYLRSGVAKLSSHKMTSPSLPPEIKPFSTAAGGKVSHQKLRRRGMKKNGRRMKRKKPPPTFPDYPALPTKEDKDRTRISLHRLCQRSVVPPGEWVWRIGSY